MTDLLARLLTASQWGALLALGVSCGGESESDPANTGGTTSGGSGGTTSGGTGGTTSGGTGGTSSGGSGGTTSGGSGGTSSGGAGTGGTGGAPADAGPDAALPTVPYPTPAGCSGPAHDGGYWGQCCEKVGCTPPTNGECPPLSALYGKLTGYPTGSGSCSCGAPDQGPFAPKDPATEAACCYVFSSIGCDGRPLIVDGATRLAKVVRRADWARTRRAA